MTHGHLHTSIDQADSLLFETDLGLFQAFHILGQLDIVQYGDEIAEQLGCRVDDLQRSCAELQQFLKQGGNVMPPKEKRTPEQIRDDENERYMDWVMDQQPEETKRIVERPKEGRLENVLDHELPDLAGKF